MGGFKGFFLSLLDINPSPSINYTGLHGDRLERAEKKKKLLAGSLQELSGSFHVEIYTMPNWARSLSSTSPNSSQGQMTAASVGEEPQVNACLSSNLTTTEQLLCNFL